MQFFSCFVKSYFFVQFFTEADNSCIGGLCDGFQKEENIGCTVGRCECPEEKEFCTNRAELSSQVHKGRRIEQPDSGESSADNPKIVHISETYVFGRKYSINFFT